MSKKWRQSESADNSIPVFGDRTATWRRRLRRFSLLAAALPALMLTASGQANSGSEDTPMLRPLRDSAQRTLAPRGGSSRRAAAARSLRKDLRELREALAELDGAPSNAATRRAWAHRNAAEDRWAALATSLPPGLRTRLDALWFEVDSILVDPVGQQQRAVDAQRLLDDALKEPVQGSKLAVSVRLADPPPPGPPGN